MDETIALLLKEGTYLVTIEYNGFRISLYSVFTDYYEVFYNPTEYRIEKIIQASDNDLNKYLNRDMLAEIITKYNT